MYIYTGKCCNTDIPLDVQLLCPCSCTVAACSSLTDSERSSGSTKSAGLSLTARNISTIGVLCEAAAGPVCVKALIKTLVEYWSNFVKTEFPEQAPIELGSRVKLWAAGTHRDIGFAWGKEPRYVPIPLQVYTD